MSSMSGDCQNYEWYPQVQDCLVHTVGSIDVVECRKNNGEVRKAQQSKAHIKYCTIYGVLVVASMYRDITTGYYPALP